MSWSNTVKRELYHILGGLFFPILALFVPRTILLVSLSLVTFITLLLEFLRLKKPSLNRWLFLRFSPLLKEAEVSRLSGTSYVLIASLIVFLAFPRDVAVLAAFFCSCR